MAAERKGTFGSHPPSVTSCPTWALMSWPLQPQGAEWSPASCKAQLSGSIKVGSVPAADQLDQLPSNRILS